MADISMAGAEQRLSAQWYAEAREAVAAGDYDRAVEKQGWARFRAMSARRNLIAVLDEQASRRG